MWQRDFCAGCDGNVSARLDDGQVMVTPTGMSKSSMRPDDLCLTDMAGQVVENTEQSATTGPSSELGMHLSIYRKRRDVNAVIHAHPPYGTAWACSGLHVPDAVHAEAVYFLGHIPVVTYSRPGLPRLGESVAAVIGSNTTCVLLQNHGVVTFGPSLLEAYHYLEMLERYLQVLTLTHQLGQVRNLTQDEIAELKALKAKSKS